jgi:hypothetical protein
MHATEQRSAARVPKTVPPFRVEETLMATPHEFLENWVRDSVQATPYRNKAEARRLTYECRKAAQKADLNWHAVIKAAGGDVEGYIIAELDRVADREAEHV